MTPRDQLPVLRDYAPSSGQSVQDWLARLRDQHGLVPEDEPYPAVDELGLSVLRFAMVPHD